MKKSLSQRTSYNIQLRLISLVLMLVIAVFSNSAINAVTTDYVNWLIEQTFTVSPDEGVIVTLSGELPAGGSAEALPAEIKGGDILHAYDITIYYADGREYEPLPDKPVRVSFRSDRIALALGKEQELSVEHIRDNGKAKRSS